MPRPKKPASPFRYFNSSPEIIRLVVMMYVRFPLSLRTGTVGPQPQWGGATGGGTQIEAIDTLENTAFGDIRPLNPNQTAVVPNPAPVVENDDDDDDDDGK